MGEVKNFPKKVPPALGLCSGCLEKAEGNNLIMTAYCDHAQSGAMMWIIAGKPSGEWQITTPVSRKKFSNTIRVTLETAELMAAEIIEVAKKVLDDDNLPN